MARMAGELAANYDKLPSFEKMVELQGSRHGGRRGMIVDEGSSLFSDKRYMQGMAEVLMQGFDNPDRLKSDLKSAGSQVAHQPSLSLLTATTPAQLASGIGDREWHNGLLARMALLTPENMDVAYEPVRRAGENHRPSVRLTKSLHDLYQKLPPPLEMMAFEDDDSETMPQIPMLYMGIDDAALEKFNAYNQALWSMTAGRSGLDERLTGVYGRLPVLGLKLAMLVRLIDWAEESSPVDKPFIGIGDWVKAQLTIEKWRVSAHRLLGELNRSPDMRNEDAILAFLKARPRPMSQREIQRGTKIHQRRDVRNALLALVEDGKIAETQRGSSKAYLSLSS